MNNDVPEGKAIMERRPISLTIIAWYLIITAASAVVSVLTMSSNPVIMARLEQMNLSVGFEQAFVMVGVVVSLLVAYGVLKGLPWSRVLYMGASIVQLVFGLFMFPVKSQSPLAILGLIFFAIVAVFLFQPVANRWFAAKGLELWRGDVA